MVSKVPVRVYSQSCFWHELERLIASIPGVQIADHRDLPCAGSWLDFTYKGEAFSFEAEDGRFLLFAEHPEQCHNTLELLEGRFAGLLLEDQE